ncbi:hypothetical protein [Amycolatopsis sp. CA-126428]|uniref:hypothetical protein n=1 Tax=Amycolatopsis sp. CA-126428 TaxID=2073158 RepID=UPI000CCFFD01|nr:hypothetical protein [Amycolatopsis sp. CA-126428]
MALNIGELVAFLKINKADWDRGKAAAKRDLEDIGDEAEKSGKKVDRSTKDAATKAEKNFNGMKFAGLTAGLPAAAAIGSAAVAGSLVLMTAGFAAFGVAAVAKSDAVQARLSVLSSQFKSDAATMSEPLQDDVVGAIDDVGAAWVRLRPLVTSAVQASAPQIRQLTGAATDLGENAMPGVLTAVRAAGPVFQGLRSFAAQAGQGISEFSSNASRGAQGAGDGLSTLGGIVRTVEARLGALFANVANGSAGPLRSLFVIVDEVTGGLVDLTSQGSGALGVLQGFSSAGSGLATVLHGVLTAVSALPPQVTQFVGGIGAAGMILSKFGVDAGAGFEGLGAKIKAADGVGGKFKTTMSGLAAGALNPAALATAGLGVALLLMGQDAERAAKAAATLDASQRSYTEALRASKGAIDDSVRASVAQDLAQKNINGNSKSLLDFAKQYGVALPQVTSAVMGEKDALDAVNRQLDAYAKANPDAATTVHALQAAIASKGIAFRESTDATAAEAAATNQSTEAQNKSREAVNALTQAIYAQQNAQLGYRGAVLNSKQALADYAKVSKDGKATEDDKARSLLGVEQAFAAQEQAAYQAAYANSAARDESGKVSDALRAQNRETINLANSWSGPLPASLQQSISKMSVADLTASGLKVNVNNLGQAVVQLPGGKNIVLTSNAAAEEAKVAALRDRINELRNREITIAVNTFYGTSGRGSSLTGPAIARKDGGLVGGYANGGAPRFPYGGLFRGVGGPRDDANLIAISDREFIVNAAATSRNLPLLQAINSGAQVTPAAAHAGVGGGSGRTTTVNIGTFAPPANASPWDIAEELDWMARTGG